MSIKKALKVFEKFAEIPIYPKCQVCGAADPDANPDDPYCYKHFDPSKHKPTQTNNSIKYRVGTFKIDAINDVGAECVIKVQKPVNISNISTPKFKISIEAFGPSLDTQNLDAEVFGEEDEVWIKNGINVNGKYISLSDYSLLDFLKNIHLTHPNILVGNFPKRDFFYYYAYDIIMGIYETYISL